ncbi:MAG: LysM peptidoglycan-binding domain-containing protein [Planctomycetota bacterium]|jgi:nucleoid-associated protein YgaU
MTRDAKIGLLLGLAFIFVIAFIVNGLPSLRGSRDKDSNELTAGMANLPNRPAGLGVREREVLNRTTTVDAPSWRVPNPLVDDQGVRYTTPLPYRPLTDTSENPLKPRESRDIGEVAKAVVAERKPVVVKNPKPVTPALPKLYVVEDGDNLSTIALKFYGPEAGNKRAVVTALFKANSNQLKSPDDIYLGQELIVPALSALTSEKKKNPGGLASTLFEKVRSIGRENITVRARQGKSYTVRDGDSLWKIAANQLGDGSRYTEILTLNKDVLSDEDSLTVGVALKIPPK